MSFKNLGIIYGINHFFIAIFNNILTLLILRLISGKENRERGGYLMDWHPGRLYNNCSSWGVLTGL